MIRSSLPSEILSRYPSDKTTGTSNGGHNYSDFYDRYLPPYRWCEAVLELGILGGASLRAWSDYFPDAAVHALDICDGRLINEGRIRSFKVDCSSEDELTFFALDKAGLYSVIIDDASHRIEDQLLTVKCLRKCLRSGGIMVIEDVSSVANAEALVAVGMTVVEFDVANRFDDRIAYFLNVE